MTRPEVIDKMAQPGWLTMCVSPEDGQAIVEYVDTLERAVVYNRPWWKRIPKAWK